MIKRLSKQECDYRVGIFNECIQVAEWVKFTKELMMDTRLRCKKRQQIRKREQPMKGVVYFIRAKGTNLFKIGQTVRSAETRLKDFQTGCPYKLEVYEKIYTDRPLELEKAIHRKLVNYHQHGEWFDVPIAVVKSLLDLRSSQQRKESLTIMTPDGLRHATEKWEEKLFDGEIIA